MHVLRHDDIAVDVDAIPKADSIQIGFEDVTRVRCAQSRLAPVTTESDEVRAAEIVEALQSPGLEGRVEPESDICL